MTNTWKHIRSTPFRQDTIGVTLSDGTYYEPSFAWFCDILASRSDGQEVYVRVKIEHDKFTPEIVGLEFQNALQTLDVIWKDAEVT